MEGSNNFRSHNTSGADIGYTPAIGAVLSRTIGDVAAVYLDPIWAHNTLPGAAVTQNTFYVGLGTRVRVVPTVFVVAEVSPRVSGYTPGDAEFAFAIEKRVGAHVFSLTFMANTQATTYGQLARGGNPETSTSASTSPGSSTDQKESLTMKRLSVLAVALALFAVGCGSSSSTTTTPTAAATPIFTAALSPANEVPPITNAESTVTGTANITLNTTKDAAGNITAATATFAVTLGGFPAGSTVNIAHIHEGATTCACPVVVNLALAAGEVTVANGLASFTKTSITVTPEVAQRILTNPAGFYFNVHTTLNGGGVARGHARQSPVGATTRDHARPVRGGGRRSRRHDAGFAPGACRRRRSSSSKNTPTSSATSAATPSIRPRSK